MYIVHRQIITFIDLKYEIFCKNTLFHNMYRIMEIWGPVWSIMDFKLQKNRFYRTSRAFFICDSILNLYVYSPVSVSIIVLILDGNSVIGASVMGNLCFLICVRHLIRSRAVKNRLFYPKIFLECASCSELPSHISTMVSSIN